MSQTDIAITEEEAARGVELQVRHSPFRNTGDQFARCEDCHWSHRGSQAAVTAASRRHVRAFVAHQVWTTRTQQKITRMRKVTVIR